VPQCAATRPATDLVRSAVFSILESMQPDWTRVLDLFAGSGALGLEALSRGAGWVDFVDQDHRCCSTIRQNAETMGFSTMMHVYCEKVLRAVSTVKDTYGLVFLDPPYADESLPSLIGQIAGTSLVQRHTVVTVLHSSRRTLDDSYGRLLRIKERRHGDTMISMYKEVTLP